MRERPIGFADSSAKVRKIIVILSKFRAKYLLSATVAALLAQIVFGLTLSARALPNAVAAIVASPQDTAARNDRRAARRNARNDRARSARPDSTLVAASDSIPAESDADTLAESRRVTTGRG